MQIVSQLASFYNIIYRDTCIQRFIEIQKVCKINVKSRAIFYNNSRKDKIENKYM